MSSADSLRRPKRVGHILLGDDRLDRVDAQWPLRIDILLEDAKRFVRGLGLEEAEALELLGLTPES